MSHYARPNMSRVGAQRMGAFFKVYATLAEVCLGGCGWARGREVQVGFRRLRVRCSEAPSVSLPRCKLQDVSWPTVSCPSFTFCRITFPADFCVLVHRGVIAHTAAGLGARPHHILRGQSNPLRLLHWRCLALGRT